MTYEEWCLEWCLDSQAEGEEEAKAVAAAAFPMGSSDSNRCKRKRRPQAV